MLWTILLFSSITLAVPIYPRVSSTNAGVAKNAPEPFVLPKPTEGPGPTFDATATRAATKAQIRSAASPGTCFDVSDFHAGDFRFDLVPLALKTCDSNIDGQKFDLVTRGEHNDVPDGSRIIMLSSQQLTCIDRRGNKNDRNRPGLFACGGRAAGDGETTPDQQFFFNTNSTPSQLSKGVGFPVVNTAVNNGIGTGNTCLTFNTDGFVSNAPCSPPNFTPEQVWFVEEVPANGSSGTSPGTLGVQSPPPVSTTTSLPPRASTASSEPFILPTPKEGTGPTFDATATRAATQVQLRSAASINGTSVCFDVSDFTSGDFRFNLVPLALKPCDTSIEGQRFDLITKGEHNNTPGGNKTIIVSSQQLTCVDRRGNINDRNRPGLFACGGRAAGDGGTTDDQLFFFNATSISAGQIAFPLVRGAVNNGIGTGNGCLTLNLDGFMDSAPCSPPNFTPEQTWIITD
ncbi:hypothetical protein P691DRAFT_4272 [Macrolepiota fuliginosa MF-IS2]|uniref:Ricin B lectin domain-containing protein n=1 Tax=Macrolepiota fuliginosa MF-IS2 TaxID=1400762 RepID=A0A9P5XQ66_9AGAR|nr:hypothetical protein P691DRAFT_4272 [Macrolepiota fuliginosa MF-IS2]